MKKTVVLCYGNSMAVIITTLRESCEAICVLFSLHSLLEETCMNLYECFDIWLSQQNRPKGRGLCIKMTSFY